jgi:fructoselysine-6-phosphate deglycase
MSDNPPRKNPMLNFDQDRFVAIQKGSVAVAEKLDATVRQCLDDGAENLFFLGAGGVMFLTQPAVRLLQTRSTFPVHYEMGAELVETDSVHLGPKSLVIMPSLSGTTKEAVAALEFAKNKGATVISFTGHSDTPMRRRPTTTSRTSLRTTPRRKCSISRPSWSLSR